MAIVSCNFPSNLPNSNSSYPLSDYCPNFSSLDSSLSWTFSATLSANTYTSDAINFYLISNNSSPLYLNKYPNFRFFQYPSNVDGVATFSYFLITDLHPQYFSFPNYYLADISSFTISDEGLPSEDCPVCEECQECPVIPDNPYDEKLDNITQAIYTCGAILLVIYFFYCIYRMLIKNSGGK